MTSIYRILWIAMIVATASAGLAAEPPAGAAGTQTASQAASLPASQPGGVPAAVIQKMRDLLTPPEQPATGAARLAMLHDRMLQVIEAGQAAQKDYAGAADLYKVQDLMLPAADFLARYEPSPAARQRLEGLARALLASAAPDAVKIRADAVLTGLTVLPQTDKPAADDAAQQIEAFVARHESSPATTLLALRFALDLSDRAKLAPTRAALLDKLAARYGEEPEARVFLARYGWFKGRPFQADLTRMDGSKLRLPGDLAGKVVLVDFWATWCGPCWARLPMVRDLYSKYKDQGLEIVGISLDTDRDALRQAVTDNSIPWLQTFTGKEWQDPTAVRYGVVAIPSLWLLGRDGKIISSGESEDVEPLIVEALKAPASRAASQPAK